VRIPAKILTSSKILQEILTLPKRDRNLVKKSIEKKIIINGQFQEVQCQLTTPNTKKNKGKKPLNNWGTDANILKM
jgi:mRNA-degrading endonuclease RelE of RelBE toxin-antitoxin system